MSSRSLQGQTLFSVLALLVFAAGCRGGGGNPDGAVDGGSYPCTADYTPAPARTGPTPTGGFDLAPLDAELATVVGPNLNPTGKSWAAALDADGDGDLDLTIHGEGLGNAWLWKNTGSGMVLDAEPWREGLGIREDMDDNGVPDLVDPFLGFILWDHDGSPPDFGARTLPDVLPVSAQVWDVDRDGLLDLVLSGPAAPNPVLVNQGDRTFVDLSNRYGLSGAGFTWSTAFVDFDGDGLDDAWTLNDSDGPNLATRRTGFDSEGQPTFLVTNPHGEACDERGVFGELGLASPMGMAVGDLTDNGRLELWAALTLVDDLYTQPAPGAWQRVTDTALSSLPTTSTGDGVISWSPRIFDVDRDGRLDVLAPGGDDQGHTTPDRTGVSAITAWRGTEHGLELATAEWGLDAAMGHHGGLTRIDLDGDGIRDLVVSQLRGPPRAYLSRFTGMGPVAHLELVGTTSNPAALGTLVDVALGEVRRRYQVGDAFGLFVTDSDHTLEIALGAASTFDATIRWPTGYVQTVRGITAGEDRRIVEPELIALSPAGRHLPADGTSELTVTARAFDAAGAPRSGATITIEAAGGTVDWTGPATAMGETVERTLRAPTTAGSATIEVTIDGVPVTIRPRIWFD